MINYTDVAVKFVLGFICIIAQINLSGKGNLAPTNVIDQMQNYVLGGIIGGIIYNQSITPLQFFLVLVIWTIVVLLIRFMTNHNRIVKKLVDGTPLTVIENGKISVSKLTQRGMTANTLMFKLRTSGIEDLTKVKKAILEQNGQLTVIQEGESMLNAPLITDGQLNVDSLESLKKDEAWLENEVHEQGFQVSDVYLATYEEENLKIFPYRTKHHHSK
ncbi:DUF421 domain-containing protein [Xylocopilactobacillus apicola]|uniref:DUF421 domain-containing protein n=1 Tax=Xylocopilactobacillus apicola TaxID=2932184 RepID=A0AAU9DEE6_9LACO|nr:DUF421 domain-containing protein [Xylocopilactobacillus apicola]BDR58245.1 DUF421 domain-containing protein [Xylocopilactobacillus apicola]